MRATTTALVGLLLLSACGHAQRAATKAPQVVIAPASATPLFGGDARAWLSYSGDNEDSNYCKARLKLPLAGKSVWSYEYTSAQFSGQAPDALLHYDGRVVAEAGNPQLLVLDAASGKVLHNKDVYVRDSDEPSQETLQTLFISPTGRLLADDDHNRIYCLSLDLQRLWSRPTFRYSGSSAFVADAKNMYCSWGLPQAANMHALDIETNKLQWLFPMTASNSSRGYGLTLGRPGMLLCYNLPNMLRGIRGGDGKPVWTVYTSAAVIDAPLDNAHAAAHVLLWDDSVECRNVADGALRWRYDWGSLLPPATRVKLAARLANPRVFTADSIHPAFASYSITPEGSYLALATGHVIHLGLDGKAIWTVKLDSAVRGLQAYSNALLVVQRYETPRTNNPGRLDPYNLDPPAWKAADPPPPKNDASFTPRPRWERVVALDPETGAILSTVQVDTLADANLCPAGSCVVLGGGARGSTPGTATHYITAYPWLEP